MIKELIEMVKRDEGTGPMTNGRHRVYKDSEGIDTVGYGRNIEERGLSPDEADYLLENDISEVLKECYLFDWFAGLGEVRQVVVCNMVFNMGLYRFSGFKKTIAYIADKQYVEASVEMLDSKWAKQVGPRATRLSKMMATGGDYHA